MAEGARGQAIGHKSHMGRRLCQGTLVPRGGCGEIESAAVLLFPSLPESLWHRAAKGAHRCSQGLTSECSHRRELLATPRALLSRRDVQLGVAVSRTRHDDALD